MRSRVEPELVGQLALDPLVRREGVRLAAGSIQSGDQQLPQALLERIPGDGGLQVADDVATVRESQPRRELHLEEFRARLLELCPVRVDPLAFPGCLKQIPPEQLQRRQTHIRGAAVVASLEQTGRRGHQAQRGDRIDVRRLDGERVAASSACNQGWIPERPAQHGDLGLQSVAPSGEAARGPQVVDEPIRQHH